MLRYETGIFSSGLSAVYSDRSDEYVQSGRSKFDLGVDIAVMATEKLRLEVDYNLYAGRKMHIVETNSVTKKETDGSETSSINIVPFNKNLKSINEFNFKASYVFNDMFTAYFLLNNLFNQKYDLWYGMPMQHINFRLGCNVNF